MRFSLALALPLALAALPSATQIAAAQEDAHAACATMGWVPREILERPVPLRPGVGNSHERVTTSAQQAQAFYDQGLNYLHGYVWIEAARSFRQALRHDPDLAMPYLGLSRVYSGLDDPAAARSALEQAKARAGGASARERRRIELRARQLDAMDELVDPAKHAAYKKAVDEALTADLDDSELWLVRGNAEEPSAAGRGQRGGAASTAFYHRALQLEPENGAAHHYLTHSYETIGQIEPALKHGEAYARLAPAIPHAHHMWAHDLRRVGRIDEAIAAFRKTDELEKAYYAAERIAPGLDWHHAHNLDLLATAYQHKGQLRKAEATMRETGALPPVTEYLEFNQKQLPVFLLARERWQEALLAAQRLTPSRSAAVRAVGNAVLGHAQLGLRQAEAAHESLAAAERELAAVPALTAGLSINHAAVKPWVDTLRGEVELRSGRAAEGRATLKAVQRTLRAIPGPDAWTQALFRLESIARIARELGDWELAEYTASQMLEHDPSYAGTHYALAMVAQHKSDRAGAERAFAAAEKYWRDADPELPELAYVRQRRVTQAR